MILNVVCANDGTDQRIALMPSRTSIAVMPSLPRRSTHGWNVWRERAGPGLNIERDHKVRLAVSVHYLECMRELLSPKVASVEELNA